MPTVFPVKKLLLYIPLLLIAACSQPKEEAGPMDWLRGTWIRSNDTNGRQTFEQWEKESNTRYRGHGYTLLNTDTVWQEHMLLSKEAEAGWQLKVMGEDNTVSFAVSGMGKRDFICKNPQHDFPKKISYQLGTDSLRAVISGGGEKVVFMFGRQE